MTEQLYPVGLVLKGRPVLMVGGGAVAERKVAGLVAAGAVVTVVAPMVRDDVAAMAARVQRRAYQAGDLDGQRLVICATDDPAVNQQVFDDAEARGMWANVADDPDRCSFTLPSVHRTGAVTIAVATDGRSPALARWLRQWIAAKLPAGVATAAAALGDERDRWHREGRTTEGHDWTPMIETLLGERLPGTNHPTGSG